MAQATRSHITRKRRAHSKAATTVSTDPIFAAIDDARRAWAEFGEAVTVKGKFDMHPADRCPEIKMGCGYTARSASAINKTAKLAMDDVISRVGKRFAALLRGPMSRVRQDMKKALDADAAAIKKAQDRLGITAANKRWVEANDAHNRALARLRNATPRTAEGIAALAAFAAEIYTEQLGNTWTTEGRRFFSAIARGAERVARKAVRP